MRKSFYQQNYEDCFELVERNETKLLASLCSAFYDGFVLMEREYRRFHEVMIKVIHVLFTCILNYYCCSTLCSANRMFSLLLLAINRMI